MLSNSQTQEVQKLFGKPMLTEEICFYVLESDETKILIERIVQALAETYGYALYESVGQATQGKDGKAKYQNISRIRVLTSNQVFQDNLSNLAYIVYAILKLFRIETLDIAINGTVYRLERSSFK